MIVLLMDSGRVRVFSSRKDRLSTPGVVINRLVSPVSLAVNPVKLPCIFQGGRRHYLILIFCFHAAKMTVWHGSLKDRIYIFTAMTPAL